MNFFNRLLRCVKDGRFAISALNRVSRTKYVPAPDSWLDDFLAEHYPGDGWKVLSQGAKQIWIDLSPVFSIVPVKNIAYVGAHDGQIARCIDEAFPNRHFYLIEPVPSTFQKLLGQISSRPNMEFFNLAAGEKEEVRDMFVDDFSPASSLLHYEGRAIQEFPFLGKGHAIKVHMMPLDKILHSCGAAEVDMLIMDVQGYEDKVLKGAERTIKSCVVVMSELSLQDLYRGASTFDSVYQTLVRKGFQLRHLLNPLKGTNQTILQIDGIFVRTANLGQP
jgi:FkbM family methyltransferase